VSPVALQVVREVASEALHRFGGVWPGPDRRVVDARDRVPDDDGPAPRGVPSHLTPHTGRVESDDDQEDGD